MRRPSAIRFARVLFLVLLLLPPGARAADGIADLLQRLQEDGFESPTTAIAELEALRAEAGPSTPPDLRMRYHAALADVYIVAEDQEKAAAVIGRLERMARDEACAGCRHYSLLRQAQAAMRRQDMAAARRALDALGALPAWDDRALGAATAYVRGSLASMTGDHVGAIEHGIEAERRAAAIGDRATQVRALNLLMLANMGRRDLDRALTLGEEAYALAERIGFTYMMAYVRGNQGWLHALRQDPAAQYRALTDALRITRGRPGLADAELVALINLAGYHAEREQHAEAASRAAQAAELARRQGKDSARGVALTTLGAARIGQGRVEEGLRTIERSVALLESQGARGYLIDALQTLADAYEGNGRYRQAVATLRRVATLRADAEREERDRALAEAQEKFSAERKDQEIERLSLENARRSAELSARTARQRLWAAAALALAFGAILLVQLASRMRSRNRLLEKSNATLSEQSVHDPLTGAFNRRHCHALMGQQEALIAARSGDRRYSPHVGLVLIDIDHFKQVNDTHGHAAGDAVLVEVAHRLQQLVRTQDTVVRWGGEEFVLVLPGTAAAGVAIVAERALAVVAEARIDVDGLALPVTISAGCATFPVYPGQHWEQALHVADLALYLAKQRGRNRAVCLMGLVEGADAALAVRDLAAAERAGQVELRTIEGPAPARHAAPDTVPAA